MDTLGFIVCELVLKVDMGDHFTTKGNNYSCPRHLIKCHYPLLKFNLESKCTFPVISVYSCILNWVPSETKERPKKGLTFRVPINLRALQLLSTRQLWVNNYPHFTAEEAEAERVNYIMRLMWQLLNSGQDSRQTFGVLSDGRHTVDLSIS